MDKNKLIADMLPKLKALGDSISSSIESVNEKLVSEDELKDIVDFFTNNKSQLTGQGEFILEQNTLGDYKYNPNDAWIQTYSGRRFTPLNPYPDAIVIQDIAHSLSRQCRFSGHTKHFYSVAQHSVLVSYVCDSIDSLWGLLHDASEAYLVDIPAPLKRSGEFNNYLEMEKKMMEAICTRFSLPIQEPASIKPADMLLLATEARDLMSVQRTDWKLPVEPLPFKIEPLNPDEAEDLFTKRFYQLTGSPDAYEHYLDYKYGK